MSSTHNGQPPFAQNAFNDRRSSTFERVHRVFGSARFPSHKRDLAGRARDETVEAANGHPLRLRRIIEEAARERFESLADIVEDVETAIDRSSEGTFAEIYSPNRPHG